jgi:hypothetical protein
MTEDQAASTAFETCKTTSARGAGFPTITALVSIMAKASFTTRVVASVAVGVSSSIAAIVSTAAAVASKWCRSKTGSFKSKTFSL